MTKRDIRERIKKELNDPVLPTNSKPLLYDDIFVGLRVIDNDGDIGTIEKIEDIYNIIVKYDNVGIGFTCLNGCCNDVLYAII